MKQQSTNRMENIKGTLKAFGLCLMLAAGASVSVAQQVTRPTGNSFTNEQNTVEERNAGTSPIRNNTSTQLCPAITTIHMVDLGSDKILVEWSNTANFDSILFRVTPHGLLPRIIAIAGTPNPGDYFITGLLSLTTYDIEVSSICPAGISTPWSTPLTVTTLGIPRFGSFSQARNFNRLQLNPNPASTITKISFLTTANDPTQITITSSTSQVVYKKQLLPSAEKVEMNIDVTGFPIGVYFVKVSNSTSVSVERLIVQ